MNGQPEPGCPHGGLYATATKRFCGVNRCGRTTSPQWMPNSLGCSTAKQH